MARLDPAKYDPADDSSKGSEKHRKGDSESDVILIVEANECPSGNRKPVSQKPKRTFSQGGDARLKGILQRCAATGAQISTVTKGKTTRSTATAMAKTFNLASHVSAFVDRAKAQAAEAEKRAEALEARRAAAKEASAAKAAERETRAAAKKATATKKAAAKKAAPRKASARKAPAAPKTASEALAEANAS